MVVHQEVTVAALVYQKSHPRAAVSDNLYFSQLGLKWEAPPDPSHDFLQFIRRNRTDTLMGMSSSTAHIDLATDIWDTQEHRLLHRFVSPGNQTSCMDWLSSDAFITGGHDNTLSLWREGQRAGR